MAEVTLSIGGHNYQIACRDGEEPHLLTLAMLVDKKIGEARSAVGDLGEVRQLLLAALLFADEHIEANSTIAPSATASNDDETAAIEALADQIENIAAKLEKSR